ncbi:MAG: aminoglycoside phosphotransferase family protein [Caldilineaceae bacterium]
MSAIHDLPADATMPSLPVALDPVLMAARFQPLLFPTDSPTSDRFRVAGCTIGRVKYRVQEKCVISYTLRIEDKDNERAEEHLFCARLFPTGLSHARYRKAQREPLVQSHHGDAVMHLPELDMVIWAFPNDRKIAGLARLMASAARQNQDLDDLVTGHWGTDWQIVRHTHELVHYVPEHTTTVRVRLLLDKAASSAQPVRAQEATLFGKAYYNDEGAETYRLMQLLWQRNARQLEGVRVAQPLAYDPETHVLWQMGLPGRTLLTYELGSPHFLALLPEAAQSVARLHVADLLCARTTHLAPWLSQLPKSATLLEQVRPDLLPFAHALVQALLTNAPQPGDEPQATLHGDLHLQNFFVDESQPVGQRLALIDLDNLSTGSPWRDLGSFCASLYYRGLVEGKPMALLRQIVESFCTAYAHYVPWPLSRSAVDWYTAAALLNERVHRSISRLKAGRLELLDDLIWLATSLLSS